MVPKYDSKQMHYLPIFCLSLPRYQAKCQKAGLPKIADKFYKFFISRSWNLGKTPLIFAAMYGKLDIVKTLVTKGADVNVKDLAGNSALMMAAK